jgi:hypothetical protein
MFSSKIRSRDTIKEKPKTYQCIVPKTKEISSNFGNKNFVKESLSLENWPNSLKCFGSNNQASGNVQAKKVYQRKNAARSKRVKTENYGELIFR